MSGIRFNLPWPPTANHHTATGSDGHRYKSPKHRAYVKAVAAEVMAQRVPRHWTDKKVAVGLILFPPTDRAFDLDNRVKPTLDALVQAGVIEDDQHVDTLLVARGATVPTPGYVSVKLQEMDDLQPHIDVAGWYNAELHAPSPLLRIITIKSNSALGKSATYKRRSKRAKALNNSRDWFE